MTAALTIIIGTTRAGENKDKTCPNSNFVCTRANESSCAIFVVNNQGSWDVWNNTIQNESNKEALISFMYDITM